MAKKDKEKSTAKSAISAAPLTEKQRESLQKDLKKYAKSGNNVTKKELAKIQNKIKNYLPKEPPPTDQGGNFIFNAESVGESVPSIVMIPERDVVNLATEDIDATTITNLLFENIGANELVKFVRNDTIEGLNPYYNIISNLSDIRRRFNPSDLISEQITDIDSEGYSINIDNKIPDQEYLDAQGITDYVYIDEATGDLVIHVVNMKDSETVEVQIDTNGTIYEVNN